MPHSSAFNAYQHQLGLALVAGLIGVLAAFTAFTLNARAVHTPRTFARLLWLTAAAMVMGCGVYATHWVAMLVFQGKTSASVDVGLGILSVVVAISITWLGLGLGLWRPRFAINGGAVISGGAGGMHYIGIAALQLPAAVEWDTTYIGASVAIGMVLGAVALQTAMNWRTVRCRYFSASLMALAVVGLQFTVMVAASRVHAPVPLPRGKIDYAAIGKEHVPVKIAFAHSHECRSSEDASTPLMTERFWFG